MKWARRIEISPHLHSCGVSWEFVNECCQHTLNVRSVYCTRKKNWKHSRKCLTCWLSFHRLLIVVHLWTSRNFVELGRKTSHIQSRSFENWRMKIWINWCQHIPCFIKFMLKLHIIQKVGRSSSQSFKSSLHSLDFHKFSVENNFSLNKWTQFFYNGICIFSSMTFFLI